MAEEIMAGASAPSAFIPPTTPDAFDLLENKLSQLHALLSSCYGMGSDWFEEIGPRRRDMMMWIASDLTRDAEDLLQEVAPQVLRGPGAFSSPGAA
jgi:DNA-directed RNA polymerase specialized sigma24 family protein